MPYIDPQDRRDAWNRWYRKNKKKQVKTVKARRASITKWIVEHKATLKCATCEESHPSCLQFHHKNPEEKDLSIANAAANGWSINRIKREMAKCVVLCANCHFKEHDKIRG